MGFRPMGSVPHPRGSLQGEETMRVTICSDEGWRRGLGVMRQTHPPRFHPFARPVFHDLRDWGGISEKRP